MLLDRPSSLKLRSLHLPLSERRCIARKIALAMRPGQSEKDTLLPTAQTVSKFWRERTFKREPYCTRVFWWNPFPFRIRGMQTLSIGLTGLSSA